MHIRVLLRLPVYISQPLQFPAPLPTELPLYDGQTSLQQTLDEENPFQAPLTVVGCFVFPLTVVPILDLVRRGESVKCLGGGASFRHPNNRGKDRRVPSCL